MGPFLDPFLENEFLVRALLAGVLGRAETHNGLRRYPRRGGGVKAAVSPFPPAGPARRGTMVP